ncbi:MAG: MarR family transcriptional regulator [Planctomycetaceae bacterium]
MRQYDFEASVGYWLCVSSHAVRRAFECRLAETGMTLRQWEVLAWLSCDGNASQAQLADCLGIEANTLGGVIDRMVRDGWIERSPHEEDRRRKRLTATPKAEAAWEESIEICRQVRQQAVAGISPAELTALKRVCETIRANLAGIGMTEDSDESMLDEVLLDVTNADVPQPRAKGPDVTKPHSKKGLPTTTSDLVADTNQEASPTQAPLERQQPESDGGPLLS